MSTEADCVSNWSTARQNWSKFSYHYFWTIFPYSSGLVIDWLSKGVGFKKPFNIVSNHLCEETRRRCNSSIKISDFIFWLNKSQNIYQNKNVFRLHKTVYDLDSEIQTKLIVCDHLNKRRDFIYCWSKMYVCNVLRNDAIKTLACLFGFTRFILINPILNFKLFWKLAYKE